MRTHHCILWLWAGWRNIYDARHVNATAAAVRRAHPDWRVLAVCSDKDTRKITCDVFEGWSDARGSAKELKQRIDCFRRLRIFDSTKLAELGIAFGDVVYSLDLDTVITGKLPALPDEHNFGACAGIHAHYNGSIFAFRAGALDYVYARYLANGPAIVKAGRAAGGRLVGSDQAFMSLTIEGGHLWKPQADGIFPWPRYGVIHLRNKVKDYGNLWTFPGSVKPWDQSTKRISPFLHETYMRDFKP